MKSQASGAVLVAYPRPKPAYGGCERLYPVLDGRTRVL